MSCAKCIQKDLRAYTSSLPRGGVAAFAAKLGLTPVYLSQLAARQDGRQPGPELCVRIEQETQGVVSRKQLRPDDWHLIWPELSKPKSRRSTEAAKAGV